MDPLQEIRRYNAGRDPERLRLKYRRMRADPFAFLRGSCHLFYARLPVQGIFRSAPLAWSCGDLHLENFGSYKGDDRLVHFDLNDFDEAALAPLCWDPVRLLASLRVGAASLGLPPDMAEDLCEAFLRSYADALSEGKAYWLEPRTAQGLVRDLLDSLQDRKRSAFLDGRTVLEGRKRTLRTDGRKALPATDPQRRRVTDFLAGFAATQDRPDFYRVLDVGRRIAGTGSLGVDRYVVLIEGKGSPDGNYLLDLKQALPSAIAPHVPAPQPPWASEADRVVSIQRRMQAVAMAFLRPVEMEGRPYVLRGLQPSEDRIDLDGGRQREAGIRGAVAAMGRLTAWSQLRSSGRQGSATADALMDFAGGAGWREELQAASSEMAKVVVDDASLFGAAYDDGAFDA